MKKLICILVIIMSCVAASFADTTIKVEGKTISKVTSKKTSSAGVATSYTWKDSKGKEYTIMLSAKGKAYVVKVSAKTGKEYKQYLGEEVSAAVKK